MYLQALLKYNARVAAKAEQLMRREGVHVPGLTLARVTTRPIIALIGASLVLPGTARISNLRICPDFVFVFSLFRNIYKLLRQAAGQ
jgi:hypothetical protein